LLVFNRLSIYVTLIILHMCVLIVHVNLMSILLFDHYRDPGWSSVLSGLWEWGGAWSAVRACQKDTRFLGLRQTAAKWFQCR